MAISYTREVDVLRQPHDPEVAAVLGALDALERDHRRAGLLMLGSMD